jgi:hypothetical protein
MFKIISDFINSGNSSNGCGFFEGKSEALKYARTITKNQRRGYKRHGKLPKAFRDYLVKHLEFVSPEEKTTGFPFDADKKPIKKNEMDDRILSWLQSGQCSSPNFQRELNLMIGQILEKDLGIPSILYKADSQHLWRRMEKQYRYKVGKRPH